MNDRLELSAADAEHGVYPWFTASLIPRAIAWVSTVSAEGVANVAPHSFCTVAGIDPPTVCFVSVGAKDTLRNARTTGEFVLQIGTTAQLRAMNDSATPMPGHVSEFDEAAIGTEPSTAVAPPRVAGSPIAFECRVSGEHVIGDCVTVFGEVVHLSADRSVLAADGLPDAAKLDPLARLGRAEWSTLGEVFSLDRIRWDAWQAGRRSSDAR